MVGAAAFVAWERRIDAIGALQVRLSFELDRSFPVRAARGHARFTLATAVVSVCPFRLALSRSLWLEPCASLQVGRLTGEGLPDVTTPTVRQDGGPWVGVQQILRARLDVGKRWMIELQAGVAEPILRDLFVFDAPPVDIVRVPALSAVGGTGLSHHFW
jgi:hypothetical protein